MIKKLSLWSFAIIAIASMSHGDTRNVTKHEPESLEWKIEKVSSFRNLPDQCIPARFSKDPSILPKAKCRMG
jgi:hypothetical protein